MKDNKYAWVWDAMSHVSLTTKTRALKHFLRGKKKYLPHVKTHAEMGNVIKCALCPNMCKFDCPVLAAAGNDATSPSAKARLAYFLETGALTTPDASTLMYACCNCDACQSWCPFGFSAADILRGVRADMVRAGRQPEAAADLCQRLTDQHVLHERTVTVPTSDRGDILYFIGCEVGSAHPEIATAMLAIFDYLAVEPVVLADEWCCGAPFLNLGYIDEFITFARHQAAAIKESSCSTLICSCPTCSYLFRQVYRDYDIDVGVDVMHATEYFDRLVQDGSLPAKERYATCVYHDPCTLARKLDVTDQPRRVLQHVGIDVQEAYFNRGHTQCCGRGGSLQSVFPDIVDAITVDRLTELHRTGSRIVTACPTCKSAFVERGAEIVDIAELVHRALEGA